MIRLARRGPRLLVIVVCALAQAALPVPASMADGPPVTRIAFGSCAHQDKPQPIWDAILRYQPDLFVFAGDNVYGDLTPSAAESLPEAYAKAARIEGYRKLRARLALYAKGAVALNSASNGHEQLLPAERLRQESDGARFHRPDRHGNVAVTGDEDDRQLRIRLDELTLQIESAEPWQAHIEHEASRGVRTTHVQERACRREHLDREPH